VTLTNGYQDNEENGVIGFGGKLDIRPPYQREFVYDEKGKKRSFKHFTKRLSIKRNVLGSS
jgi:hypothetical protein